MTLLFIDFSSAFNTNIPSKRSTKLSDLGINSSLSNWILDLLTNRPPICQVREPHLLDPHPERPCPTGPCAEPPPLLPFHLRLHTCTVHGSKAIVKFADDTTMIVLISNNDESAYREEVQHQAKWLADNDLALNTKKTKELIVDFKRTKGGTHTPPSISMGRRWSVSPALNSWVSTSRRTPVGPFTPQSWSSRLTSVFSS